ncbi:type II toxin-antitoxin system HipA family toxin [Enhygromyxa salina]|uniref:Serine/threonine-protein kinase HipA n=1 Tax=Enhygromyxa salina TaxID=215803 RepID=A0A2S9YM18_9BACT|nr:HipA domain-containing protein [Enhygromyxa salina]PRQ06141.1 Serine/threonine-protein kinase HipA [Enhygromyxa salina]
MARSFDVELHGQVIGTLRESESGFVGFKFNDSYRRSRRRDVLGQAFVDKLGAEHVGKQRELPPFFANLVPEGELRPFLEQRLGIEPRDDLGLLALVGHDLPGAVEVRPRAGASVATTEDHESELTDVVTPRPLTDADEELRFSLAGMQLKFSVVRAEDKVTFPVSGERGDWLVKLDSERFPGVVENEHAMLSWAREAGFVVPACQLVPTTSLQGSLIRYAEPGVNALMISRYDRLGSDRIHQEDFAQVINARPINKYGNVTYEQLAILVQNIISETARDEFIRRLVFMIASGNSDAHLKNWSLIYPNRRDAELAPLYDQVATVAWLDADGKAIIKPVVALKLAGVRRFAELSSETFASFAERIRVDTKHVAALVHDTLERLREAWKRVRQRRDWQLAAAHEQALAEHWQRTPLLAPLLERRA